MFHWFRGDEDFIQGGDSIQVSPATAVESTKPLMEQLTFTTLLGVWKDWWFHRDWGIFFRKQAELWNIYIYVYICTYILEKGNWQRSSLFSVWIEIYSIDAEFNGLMNHALLHQPMMGDR